MKSLILNITIFFSLASNFVGAQNIDSLWKIFNTKNKPDTIRLKAIQEISWGNVYEYPDTSIYFSKIQLDFAKEKKLTIFIARALATLGKANSNKGNFLKAQDYFNQSLKIRESINDQKGIANCYTNIGINYVEQSNYSKALENYLKALKIYESIGNKEGMGDCYTNIGTVYEEQLNFKKAEEYYQKDLKISQELSNFESVAICYNNIGNSLYNQAKLKDAVEYYKKAIEYFIKTGSKQYLASCYNNIGSIYRELNENTYALDYHLKSLNLKKEIKDLQGMANCYINLSDLFLTQKDYRLSKLYSDSALKISINIGDIDNERLSYQNLAEISSFNKDFESAFRYHKKFKLLTDSIFNLENSKVLSDMKTQFEVERKEDELIAEQEKKDVVALAEKKRQRIILISVSIVGIIFLFLSIYIFRNLRINKKKNRIITLQKQMVENQKLEVEKQKYIIEEKHKEITDSINYAERIQRSLLANKVLLDDNLGEYFVLFKPKDVVSGDFYWGAILNNGLFALATADSTGHGVPGAIMSILNIACLNEAIKEGFVNPSEILNRTRKEIISVLKRDGSLEGGKDGMDVSLCVFDNKNKKLLVAAAYNPVWIVRGNEVIEIKPDKMPVGKHDKQNELFTQHEIQLQKGDVIYTLTDGFPDQFGGPKGKKFMSKNLRELLAANANLPMNEQKQLLEKTFADWVGNMEQVDDVTLIAVRV